MSRLLTIVLIGIGGYFLYQKRFRVLNMILGNKIIRQLGIKYVMILPGIKNRVINTMFPQRTNPVQEI